MNEALMDLMLQNGGQGEVAEHLMREGLNANAMRPFLDPKTGKPYVTIYMGGDPKKKSSYRTVLVGNATLRRDEWKRLDEAVLPIARTRLRGAQDLIDAGLVYDIGNGMETTVLEWHDVSDGMEAIMTMEGETRSQNDRPNFETNYLPIPIIHSDFEIGARALASSRRMGAALDTIGAENATRRVAEKVENLLFTNTSFTYGGGAIKSYINYADRNTVSLDSKWDNSGVTGANIIADVLTLKQTSINTKKYGPWNLYVPTDYETVLDEDYDTTTPGTTIRERILKISGINKVTVIDTLPDDNVLLVQMTSDTVRLVRGMPIQTVQWQSGSRFTNKFKVMTIMVPQIRSDQDGNCGIVHATFAA